jgi:hypothetical protein
MEKLFGSPEAMFKTNWFHMVESYADRDKQLLEKASIKSPQEEFICKPLTVYQKPVNIGSQ